MIRPLSTFALGLALTLVGACAKPADDAPPPAQPSASAKPIPDAATKAPKSAAIYAPELPGIDLSTKIPSASQLRKHMITQRFRFEPLYQTYLKVARAAYRLTQAQ